MQVTFFLPGETDLGALRGVEPDGCPELFRRGERVWILQTYLRLRNAGHPVRLCGELPGDGLVVFHVKHAAEVMRQWDRGRRPTLVGARADNLPCGIADFEVVQNDAQARKGRCFLVAHWPQPGLLPRPSERGATLSAVAYRGFDRNLDRRFLEPAFAEDPARQGIEWRCDALHFCGAATDAAPVDWHDYRGVDALLAVRPPVRHTYWRKPPTKLYNAWLGGVVALLGPEPAYRSLRRSELDYIEVATPRQAIAAIALLRAEPLRYLAMIDHGRRRAAECSVAIIVRTWAKLLFETLPGLVAGGSTRRWQGWPPRS